MASVDQSYKEKSEKVVATAMFGSEMTSRLKGPEGRMAATLRRKNEATNPESIIDSLAVAPASSVELKGAIERVISSQEDPITHAKSRPVGSDFETKFNSAITKADFAQEFLKKGYSRLTPAERKPYQEKAFAALLKVWPGAREGMAGLTDSEAKVRMDAMLKDPRFAAAMKESLQDVIESAKGGAKTPKEVQERVKTAKQDMDEKAAELALAQEDFDKANDEYQREYGASRLAGSKGTRLDAIPETAAALEDTMNDRKRDVDKASRIVARLEVEKSDWIKKGNAAEVSRVTDLLNGIGGTGGAIDVADAAQRAYEAAEKRHTDKLALEADKQKLEDETRRFRRELAKRGIASSRSSDNYYVAKAEEDEAGIDVKNYESSFISKLDGIVESATRKYLAESVPNFEAARDQVLQELGDTALINGINNRWIKQREGGGDNEKAIDADYRQLIADGPDEIVLRVLTEGGKMSMVDARAGMENDKDFADRGRNEVAQRLLTKRVETGKITENEARRIVDSEWGGDEIIANAFVERAKYDGVLQMLEGQQGEVKKSLIEKLKVMPGNKVAKFLLALLLFGTLFAVDMIGGFGVASGIGKIAVSAVSGAGQVVSHIPGAGEVGSFVQDKGGDVLRAAQDKGGDVLRAAQDKGGDALSAVKDQVQSSGPDAQQTGNLSLDGAKKVMGSARDALPGIVDPLKEQYAASPKTTIGVGLGAAYLGRRMLKGKKDSHGHGS